MFFKDNLFYKQCLMQALSAKLKPSPFSQQEIF